MPVLNSSEARKMMKKSKVIPGPKSLHRGIHYNLNDDAAAQWKSNLAKDQVHSDPKERMVHHQKINEELKDLYTRTAALNKENMTMEERIEQGWKDFERVGGKRPKKVVGYREHLDALREIKKEERKRAAEEVATSGDITDFSKGSALHNAKDRRIKTFVKKQLKRAHLLKRVGDPTPLKQAGRFDSQQGTLTVFNKTIRKVSREVAHDDKVSQVKQRGRGGKTMWDLRNEERNINAPSRKLVRQDDLNVGPSHKKSRRRR